jgi:hypothetical protein
MGDSISSRVAVKGIFAQKWSDRTSIAKSWIVSSSELKIKMKSSIALLNHRFSTGKYEVMKM